MSYKVIMDGSLDVPEAELERYDIPVVQPIIIIEGKTYINHDDILPDEFFRRQATAKVLPSTSQPSPAQFAEAFGAALATHDRVLYIGISAGLSGTINSARQAAQEFDEGRIVIHDTMTLTGEGGLQVVAAARAHAAGATLEEALEAAKRVHAKSVLYFTVDDLTYLIKGGRIGRAAGAVGSMLNLKPIITVDKGDGKFQPHSRVRSLKATTKRMLDLVSDLVGAGKPGRFIVVYGTTRDEADALAAQLRAQFDVRYLELMHPAPTLVAHTGPRALGICAVPGDWDY